MTRSDPCRMARYSTSLAHGFDASARLPRTDEHLTFGVHRMHGADRVCPAWPANPDAARHAAYLRWIRGASKGT